MAPIPTRVSIGGPMWIFPMMIGLFFFSIGLAIFLIPDLLEWLVAGGFCGFGLVVMGFAWRMRPTATKAPQNDGGYVDFRVDPKKE